MDLPLQSPPVERPYMRLVLGRKTPHDGQMTPPEAERRKAHKKNQVKKQKVREPDHENFVCELTVFHLRQNPTQGI
jgi:hypothetical protein